MGWWSDFTGKTAKNAINEANAKATGFLESGRTDAVNSQKQTYDAAQGYLGPYSTYGPNANKLYADALGVNGYGAQQAFGKFYAQNDPFRAQNEDMATRAISRRYNAMGSANSGAAQLASARALAERGSQDYNNYLTRLGGFAQQGQAIGGAQAQLASNHGNALSGIYSNFANQNAGNAINYGNAQAQASNIFTNNLLGVAGTAANVLTGWNSIPKAR